MPSGEEFVLKMCQSTFSFTQNIPQPCCLLLFEKDMYTITTGSDSNCGNHALTVFHHFNLLNVKEIQVSFVGQHIQLIGSSQDTFLAIFTYSKELTQELCRTLLKSVISEDVGAHPLLQQDLVSLSGLEIQCSKPASRQWL